MTPPAPIEAKSRIFEIMRSAEGNWFHHSERFGGVFKKLNRKTNVYWIGYQSDLWFFGVYTN